ncbi:hypothetical protein B0O99DRAFT_626319 [Bisporella sp. PMI_857]|nr:hypothetical protein B0O99DRAFT_626319 [Bisporella sp. PMI_857]
MGCDWERTAQVLLGTIPLVVFNSLVLNTPYCACGLFMIHLCYAKSFNLEPD